MMKKITKQEYSKALRTVRRYEHLQSLKRAKGAFGFLYWLDIDDKDHFKWVKAKNVESACAKFMQLSPKSLRSIDYEVNFGDTFIDISSIESVKIFVE